MVIENIDPLSCNQLDSVSVTVTVSVVVIQTPGADFFCLVFRPEHKFLLHHPTNQLHVLSSFCMAVFTAADSGCCTLCYLLTSLADKPYSEEQKVISGITQPAWLGQLDWQISSVSSLFCEPRLGIFTLESGKFPPRLPVVLTCTFRGSRCLI